MMCNIPWLHFIFSNPVSVSEPLTGSQVLCVCDQVLHRLHHLGHRQVLKDAFAYTDDFANLPDETPMQVNSKRSHGFNLYIAANIPAWLSCVTHTSVWSAGVITPVHRADTEFRLKQNTGALMKRNDSCWVLQAVAHCAVVVVCRATHTNNNNTNNEQIENKIIIVIIIELPRD